MFIITNFKTYESALGDKALKLASLHCKLAKKHDVVLGIVPSIMDMDTICHVRPRLSIFTQHCDSAEYGSFTGQIPPVYLKKLGVSGTLLNHSERRLNKDQIQKNCEQAKKAGLSVIICAETAIEGAELMTLCQPDFIAIEPPELIGGDISIATAQPELISHAVKIIGEGKVIVGAGIKTPEDIKIAKKLGAAGVLLASGITKAKDPETVLEGLIQGMKE
jgi:triosephosphate isomerase (TIM)